jgi:ribosomal-protein-serine acetyltransferase
VLSFLLDDGHALRLPAESDVPELHALIERNREYLARWMGWAAEQTPQDTLEFIRSTQRRDDRNEGFETAIVDPTGVIVGMIGFHAVSWRDRSAEIGYWLSADAQGRGIMTRATARLVDHALSEWKLNRIEIRAAPDNTRSRAIPKRLGFVAEGTLREAEWVGGRYVDSVVYSMLARDWAASGT